jgi:3-isopropylmalate/(R)-2-methylmalate dehydratase small subunit
MTRRPRRSPAISPPRPTGPAGSTRSGPGNIIVGGLNYDMGSSHPAARSLCNLGFAVLLAESINRLFFRNAVNFGLLALEWPGTMRHFRKGKPPRSRSRTSLKARRVPSILLDLMTHGLYSHLERQGLIEPSAAGG